MLNAARDPRSTLAGCGSRQVEGGGGCEAVSWRAPAKTPARLRAARRFSGSATDQTTPLPAAPPAGPGLRRRGWSASRVSAATPRTGGGARTPLRARALPRPAPRQARTATTPAATTTGRGGACGGPSRPQRARRPDYAAGRGEETNQIMQRAGQGRQTRLCSGQGRGVRREPVGPRLGRGRRRTRRRRRIRLSSPAAKHGPRAGRGRASRELSPHPGPSHVPRPAPGRPAGSRLGDVGPPTDTRPAD